MIYYTDYYQTDLCGARLAMWVLFEFALDTALPLPFMDFLADHQGCSQSDHRTNTGFGSFKLLTCELDLVR